ncbi:RnfH family protein [Vibrio cholerae]|nr:RnfH family protein [Vibrio cholerae]
MSSEMILVEVVYALPHEPRLLKLVVEQSATVEEIIRTSGILQMYPEIHLTVNNLGIFSRNVKLDARERDKDRIEIYRPLLDDQKEIRRKRAEQAKAAAYQS